MNHRDIDWNAVRERVAAARADQPDTTPDPEPATTEPELDVRDLGARAHGKPYQGDPLGALADRMFRH